MKKLDEIGPPERNGEDGVCDAWEKDLLIDRLTAEGHRVISVGRALVTVEQCDPEDPFP